jgi:hypothetical protein
MSMPLSAHDAELLTKLLGLLSSDHAGERASAGAKANDILRRNKMSWAEFMAPLNGRSPQLRPRPKPEHLTTDQKIGACLAHPNDLTAWEVKFLRSIKEQWSLSEKQLAVLDKIFAKIRACERARARAKT